MLTYSELRYIETPIPHEHCTIGMPPGTRCHRIERVLEGWRVWIATNDCVYGTWLELYPSGRVFRHVARKDEGDETFMVRPSDDEIRRKL